MERKVKFKIGKEVLRGSLFIPQGEGPFPSVIFFHGSSGVGETYYLAAKKLAKNGILGFAFNYAGCGKSTGKIEQQTIEMGIKDARKAIDFFLGQKEVDNKRLGFCGGSFGGFIVSLLSKFYPVKSIYLIAPAAYSKSVYKCQRDYDELRDNYLTSESYENLAKFKGDLLVSKCEFDDVLPLDMVEKYLKSAINARRKEEYILKDARHRVSINPKVQQKLINKISEWFLKTL
jgi:uncharacterized protein